MNSKVNGYIAADIRSINRQILNLARTMGQKDKVLAASITGLGADFIEQITNCTLLEIDQMADVGALMFKPRMNDAAMKTLQDMPHQARAHFVAAVITNSQFATAS